MTCRQPRRLTDADVLAIEPYVRRLIWTRFRVVPEQLADPDDLMQIAMLRIAGAVPRFDPTRGMSFRTFCLMHAHGAIRDALRLLAPGSRHGRSLTFTSLDEPVAAGDGAITLGDTIPGDFEMPDPLLGQALDEALRTLSLDEQSAVALRFYEDMKHGEIAALFDVTESRVTQILNAALAKLARHPALSG